MSIIIIAMLAAPFAILVSVVTPVALQPATLEELARVNVAPIAGEHRERPRMAHPVRATAEAIEANVVIAPQAATQPPAVTRGFQAVTDPLPGASVGYDPPDASGAVAPQYVVGAFNDALTVHDRNGNMLSTISMSQFWHDSTQQDKFLYDPRVAYDAASDRWIVVMLGDDDPAQINGVLFIAISTTGNPSGTWRRFRFPVDQSGKLDGDVSHLAVTTAQIAISVRAFDTAAQVNTTVFIMPKSSSLAGGNLSISANVSSPVDDLAPLSSDDATLRLVAWTGDTNIRTFELQSDGTTTNFHDWAAIAPPQGAPCPVSTQCLGVPLTGLARGGTMWIAQDTFENAALIWKIAGTTATTYVISDPTRAINYPSVAVNRHGAALVGITLLSSSTFPSAGYAYIDPNGNVSAPAVLKAGQATFHRDRWGDFTTTVVDPVDDTSFWTIGMYANTPLNLYERWATWWGYFKLTDTAATRRRPARH